MDIRHRVIGLLWPLLDLHSDRTADDLPEQYRGDMRALYAASEVYLTAEVAAVEARRCWISAGGLLALLRLAWTAGIIAERARAAIRSGRPGTAQSSP